MMNDEQTLTSDELREALGVYLSGVGTPLWQRRVMGLFKTIIARAERAEAERDALLSEVATLRSAAHMPDDYEYGLASWINQKLYASYIGAGFSEMVMEQIRNGRLTFPEAPIYVERDALRAERDAAVARAEAAEAERDALRAQLDVVRWRPVSEPPDAPGRIMLYRRYDEPNIWEWRNQAEWGWPRFSAAAINEGYTHWRPYPGPPPPTEEAPAQ